jgi:hypothetical protein
VSKSQSQSKVKSQSQVKVKGTGKEGKGGKEGKEGKGGKGGKEGREGVGGAWGAWVEGGVEDALDNDAGVDMGGMEGKAVATVTAARTASKLNLTAADR